MAQLMDGCIKMKKILAFSFFPAFVPVSNGGESKLYNFYKVLSKYHHVTLLTSTHPNVSEEIIYHTATFVERRIPKDNYFTNCWSGLSEHLTEGHGDLSAPTIAASAAYPTLMHEAYLQEYEAADIIIHDFPFTVDFDILLGADNKPRIYNSHNCETVLYSTLHSSEKSKPIVDIVAKAEKKLLENADLILYCGEGDYNSFKELVPHKESVMFYSPNGMIEQAKEFFPRENKNNHSAVFVGSAHLPNVSAALHIAEYIAPRCPNIIFDIIGNCLPEGKYAHNVIRHGRISDAEKVKIFDNASIALNPMLSGSGSNIKALDYFSYGIPILSTPFGMRGFNIEAGKHYIEAELDEFPDYLNEILSNKCIDNTKNIGVAGKEFASTHYTWEAIIKKLLPQIEKLTVQQSNFALVLNDYNSFSGVGGGSTRTRGLCQAINDISDVVFLCFSDDGKIHSVQYNKNTYVISLPKSARHIEEVNNINSQFHISCDDIIASNHCIENVLFNSIYNLIKKTARFIIVEHPYLTPLPIKYSDRFIYSSQNDETKLKSELHKWHPCKDYLINTVTAVEKNAVEKAAATIAVSDEDAYTLLVGKRSAGPMLVVRNGSEVPIVVSEKINSIIKNKISPKSAVFLGSAHMPNVDAVNFILQHIAPHCPEVQFNIVGSVCSSININPGRNVVLWGIVDEETKCAILSNSLFAVNPVISGSGSNIKLADFLANGLFVVSTSFGLRGYPEKIKKHVALAEPENFSDVINSLNVSDPFFSEEMRQERKSIFLSDLSMVGIAKKFVKILENIEKPKYKVLFVTYRYTHPELGGAESHLKRFLKSLGETNDFEIDVVASEVSKIHNHARFMENYEFDQSHGAPIEMMNLRFARFPVDQHIENRHYDSLKMAWRVQADFEKNVFLKSNAVLSNGLAWGWSDPEGKATDICRWSYSSCSIYVLQDGKVSIKGYVPEKSMLTFQSESGAVYSCHEVEGSFSLNVTVQAGALEIFTSCSFYNGNDPRPLGFLLQNLDINDQKIDISRPLMSDKTFISPDEVFHTLSEAAEKTRFPLNINLTELRGPHTPLMEHFISSNISKYDLVITHNIVFKPAVFAIELAKQNNIPSLLVPHAHLDDDYYHFPDLIEAARNATEVLAVPKAACDFYTAKGCRSSYLPAGADTEEEFSQSDVDAFRKIYKDKHKFVLVLGRKSGAKGYRSVIEAVEKFNKNGLQINVVMIGPDDDGVSIDLPYVNYLGRQPREVVRGALMECLALVNMSSSESFGIVLLEAWLANKPVIANKLCVAFHDMAIDNENALLVTSDGLLKALTRLINEPELCQRLADNGFKTAQNFSWTAVENKFISICRTLLNLKNVC
ncbi:glycosyltransferase [Pantoea stewartii]|uniref:glycosyltransferase n=1 Tax=Pantoea stewartii TaxID=66269 RepID=UPI0023F64665|nr:glycosyltransferase [Pantoea stewartii]MDF7785630.1 glycosyltransferase [Pantoea stewartii]